MALRIEHSVTAKCKPEHAWQKFQKMEEWPWWNRVIGQARWIDGGAPWQPGSRFVLDIAYPKRMSTKPAITENSAPHAIAWNGDNFFMRFEFTSQADGQTLLKAEAELSGLKAILGSVSLRNAMQQSISEWLTALKTESEQIAREEYARS